MSWFVYIIQSTIDGDYYKGISEQVDARLLQHNSGKSAFTSSKMPWILVCYYPLASKREAIIEEKRIKRLNRESLIRVIKSERNLIK